MFSSPLIATALPEVKFCTTNQKSYEVLCKLIICIKAIYYVKKSSFVDEMTELIFLSSCVNRQAAVQFVEATSHLERRNLTMLSSISIIVIFLGALIFVVAALVLCCLCCHLRSRPKNQQQGKAMNYMAQSRARSEKETSVTEL